MVIFLLIFSTSLLHTQQTPKYSHTDAFAPFYVNSTETRSASGEPGHNYWQNRADYKLTATLDDTTDYITGISEITYTNNSFEDLGFLWLQLDQNIFSKDSRSNQTSGAAFLVEKNTDGFDGGYKIGAVEITSLNGKKQKITPEYYISDTRMQIILPEKLQAKGGTVSISINYACQVPATPGRTSVLSAENGKVYTIAQWYPRMCVYDDLNGWNTAPYLGTGEFYLEYGDITATLTVPENHFVVASGELLNSHEVYSSAQNKKWDEARNSDKTVTIRSKQEVSVKSKSSKKLKTWKFKIEQTRDFAWASSPAFVLDAARINLPSGKKALAVSAYPAESDWARGTEFTKATIEHFSEKWLEYTYPMAVNVAGNIGGGMEYPGIVFNSWQANGRGLWGLVNHEFGHNWFPMIVGSDERRHAWMDEGFNSFIDLINDKQFNKGEFYEPRTFAEDWTSDSSEKMEPIMTAPDNSNNLGYLSYYKPAVGLQLLRENILGEEVFDRAFREYIHRWAFKHPAPEDFFRTMENVSGEDLSWFFRGWFQQKWQIDQSIKNIRYRNNDPKQDLQIRLENTGQLPMPVVMDINYKDGSKKRYNYTVDIWRTSGEILLFLPGGKEVSSVVLDPENSLPDANRANNRQEMSPLTDLKPLDLSVYTGEFYNEKYKISITAVVKDGSLVLVTPWGQEMELIYENENEFLMEQGQDPVVFTSDRSSLTIGPEGNADVFLKKE